MPAIEAAASTNEEYETEVTDIEKSLKQTVVKLFAVSFILYSKTKFIIIKINRRMIVN